MDKSELKKAIIKDLQDNISVSYKRYSVDRNFYFEALKELKEELLINFTVVDENSVFDGEPGRIWLIK